MTFYISREELSRVFRIEQGRSRVFTFINRERSFSLKDLNELPGKDLVIDSPFG